MDNEGDVGDKTHHGDTEGTEVHGASGGIPFSPCTSVPPW